MKSTYLVLVASIALFACSCSNIESEQSSEGNTQSAEEHMLLAKNFRSEAAIIVEPQDEEWIGKFDNMALVNDIFKRIYDSTLTPYDLLNNKLPIAEIKLIEYSLDTIYIEDFESGDLNETVVEESLERDEITKIFLREDWYYDKQNFNIEKEVVSITLTTKKFDLEGNFLGYRALFVVYMNGKEPENSGNPEN